MKVIGDAIISGFAAGAFMEYDDFPQNPKVGTWALIHGSVMTCMQILDAPVWLPLTQARNTHVHDQSTASAIWNIEHRFGSDNVLIQCFDQNNTVIIPSDIRTIDEDTTEVVLPDIISGKAIVMYGQESGVSATGKIENSGSGFGVGHLSEFPNRDCITEGYIPLDGQRIYRSVYPDLVDIFGKELEYIDLPDVNGARLFYRGGADSEFPFGEIQGDAIRNITMSVRNAMRAGSGGTSSVEGAGKLGPLGNVKPDHYNGASYNGFDFDASLQVPTADENRPVNTSVVKCIKAFGAKVNEGSVDVPSLLERVNELENLVNYSEIQNGWTREEHVKFPIGFSLIAWAGPVSGWKIGELTKVYINSSNSYLYGCDTYGYHNSGVYLEGEWAFTGYVGASGGVETAMLVRVK